MVEMMRARIMLVEIDRDVLYISDDYRRSYGETERAARRPQTRTEALGVWRGLAGLGHDRGRARREDRRQLVDSLDYRH